MPFLAPFSFIKEPSAAPPPAQSLFSLLFNGSSQYVTLPGSPVDPDSDFTIEAWVQLSADGNNAIFAAQGDSNNYWIFIARNDSHGLCFQEAIASGIATFICSGAATVATSDDWKHVAVTRSGNTWKIYIDGALAKTDTNSDTGFAASPQNIARLPTAAVYFAGNIDEIRTWDVARTITEIADNMEVVLSPSEPNLTGYWRFEDGAGTTASDELGANDGTLVGSPTWSSDTPI